MLTERKAANELGLVLRVDTPIVRPDGTLGVRVVNSWRDECRRFQFVEFWQAESVEEVRSLCVGHSIVAVQPAAPVRPFTWGSW